MDNMADDFYEDDEPLADVIAAFDAGPKVRTTAPLPAGAVIGTVPTTFGSHVGGLILPNTIGIQLSFPRPVSVH
jgi:hypothetical protein